MAVYFVTGKLGSGKTLAAVGKIRDKLLAGRPVATNLDLRLNKLVGPQAKKTVVYRVPDKPTVHDMRALGSGNDTYEEENNGLIVLDECGTWFNSRDWQDKDRRPLIDWLLHARKLGWDLIFIIQDVSMIDKQARKSVGEHVVYCRRLDRLKVPFLDSLYRFAFSRDMPKAKAHLGIVKYGDLPTSITVDRWWYMAKDLYPAYDTKQAFTDDYPHNIYQMLPPWYSHGRYAVKKDWRFYVRLTKIYFRRFSKVAVLSGGIIAGAAIASVLQPAPVTQVIEPDPLAAAGETETERGSIASVFDKDKEPATLAERFEGFVITGIAQDKTGEVIYSMISNGEKQYNVDSLRSMGLVVRLVNKCEILVMNQDRTENVRLYTSYCGPEKSPVTPPKMSPSERYQWKLEQVMAVERLSANN